MVGATLPSLSEIVRSRLGALTRRAEFEAFRSSNSACCAEDGPKLPFMKRACRSAFQKLTLRVSCKGCDAAQASVLSKPSVSELYCNIRLLDVDSDTK